MAERYWITGVQLGILSAAKDNKKGRIATMEVIKEVVDNQFIGSFSTDTDKRRFEKAIKKIV